MDVERFRSITEIRYNRTQYPTEAFVYINTRMLTSRLKLKERDIIGVLKDIIAEKKIKHPINDSTLTKIAREILKRLNPNRKPFKVLIAKGRDAVDGKNGKVIWHFQRYSPVGSVKNNGKIDFKEKHFITPVKKGSVLLEVILPTDGKSGYDIFDNTIPPNDGKLLGDLDAWDYNPRTIIKEKRENRVVYLAKKDGALVYKAGMYSIDNLIALKSIDIARTGNVVASLDENINLKIGKGDGVHYANNAIYPKMKVSAKNIIVNGDIGSHAVIECENLEVYGTIQQKAKIFAKKVVANVCRGIIKAETVKIDTMEYATVEAQDFADVKRIMSSRLFARSSNIGTMRNFNFVTVAETATINDVVGESNIITVNPMALWWLRDRYRKLMSDLADVFSEIESKEKQYKSLSEISRKSKEKYKKLQILIKELARKGKTDELESIMVEIRETKEIIDSFEIVKSDYEKLHDTVKELQEKIEKIRNGYKYGVISINNRIQRGNKIIFGEKVDSVIENTLSGVKFILQSTEGKEFILVVNR